MGLIRQLPQEVILKIAAGEVIQRPASVLKELVENSLDAGATSIEMEIEAGGIRRICVSDNGEGMDKDDLLLCTQRHATSKIRSFEDLYQILSFGFRGEALASIAQVSRLKIISRQKAREIGHTLYMEGGKLVDLLETGTRPGTLVEVRDLFFNTPARRKFLKSPGTELQHLFDWVVRFAFANYEVHLRFKRDGQEIFSLPSSHDPIPRIAQLWGNEIAEDIKFIGKSSYDISIAIYLGPLEQTRLKADRCLFFVNKRPIKDKNLLKAVCDGLSQAMPKGIYPQCLVFLDIPPWEIDVNIHPSKEEIRFRNQGILYSMIINSLEESLKKAHFMGEALVQRPTISKERKGLGRIMEQERVYHIRDTRSETSTPTPIFERHEIRVLGQVKDSYIVCEVKDALLVIDQHAAHERIIYDRIMASSGQQHTKLLPLIFPRPYEFSHLEALSIMESLEMLKRLGIGLTPSGENRFLLTHVPYILKDSNWDELLPMIAQTLSEDHSKRQELYHHLVATLACHGAIRAGQAMLQEEMQALVQEIMKPGIFKTCPHGRPVLVSLPFSQIEKEMRRA